MRHTIAILLLLLLLSPAASVAQTPEQAVSTVLDAFHRAASSGDAEAYFALFADESVFIGTDSWERWPRAEFEAYAAGRFVDGGGWTYTSTERHVSLADDGQTAWFDEMLYNARYGVTRGSGVLVLEDNGWKVAQYNLSIPVPNELAEDLVQQIRRFGESVQGSADGLEALVDSLAAAAVDSGLVAGMTVGVVQGDETLLLNGYGLADLEFDTPTPAHAVYEIGSITKQFTAAGILRLAERGQMDLNADVTDYLPDFDTRGRAVTIARMLDHTSGIQGYTEMPALQNMATQALPRDSLVTLMEGWPFWHEPGEQMIYNNSAYFLLGLVIESVADTTYEAFLEQEFFEPLGMTDSRYCSNTAVVPRRANGYDWTPVGLQRAAYLDHRWPYAAGSVCSSVEDLITWNRALHGGQVLSPGMYERMITAQPLNDGSPIRYAAGVGVGRVAGQRVIRHGGGIFGFLSEAVHFPDTGTTIIALINTAGPQNPAEITDRIAHFLFESPDPEPVPLDVDLASRLGTWTGIDRGGAATYTFEEVEGTLSIRRGDRPGTGLVYRGAGWFSSEGDGMRVRFVAGPDGALRMHVDQGFQYLVLERAK